MLISIIIPTFNRSREVEILVNSLIAQEASSNYEIIIVNDGSTDNTIENLKKFKDNEIIKIYTIKNSERGAARNFGAKMSSGKYLNFFDSDDIALSNHVGTAKDLIYKNTNIPVFHLSYKFKFNEYKSRAIVLSGIINNKIFLSNLLSCNGVFIRKDIFLKYNFSEDRVLSGSEDWFLWLQIANNYNFLASKEITSVIVDHQNRSMRAQQFDQIYNRINRLIENIDDISSEFSKSNLFKIKSQLYSFISMSSASLKKYKTLTIKFYLISLFYNPFTILNKRSINIMFNIFLRW